MHSTLTTPDSSSFSEQSKRGHEQLVAYWHRVKAAQRFPDEDDIEPSEIADLWDTMFLLNTNKDSGDHLKYEYMGHSLVDAYGVDLTGKVHDEYTEPNIKSILRACSEVASKGIIAVDDGAFTNKRGELVKYRCSLVPLSAKHDREHVHYILGLLRWKRS